MQRECKATLVEEVMPDDPSITVVTPPGSFQYFETVDRPGVPAGIIFRCPCGCADTGSIKFDTVPKASGDDQRWHWDGNREQPTLTPSLNKTWGCKWHGYLTGGVFRHV